MDKQCKCIHETIIRDILDVISDVKDADELDGFHNKNSFSSIAKASNNLTLVFPVIVSKGLTIDSAAMVTKAIERKCVMMLQMLFSAMNISNSDNAMEYIKQFHTNMKMDDTITSDSIISAMDDLVLSKEGAVSEYLLHDPKTKRLIENDMKNINYVLPDSINECGLDEYTIINRMGNNIIVNEDYDTNSHNRNNNRNSNNRNNNRNSHNRNNNNRNSNNMNSNNMNYTTINYGDRSNGNNGDLSSKDRINLLRYQLLDNDVKKSNELVPTTMMINFVSKEGDKAINTQAVIGVKAKMYPVDQMDIVNRLAIKNKDRNRLIEFVRSTTREISFVRDFLFCIDKCKMDALSTSSKGSSSKLWKLLERRALKSKIRRGLGQVNDASAITTLVITQEEVEYLKKTEHMDLANPNIVRPIMESLNFMAVCIVDEASEKASFIFDTGDDIYETLPFSSLERENNDTNYKKILNLMGKIR